MADHERFLPVRLYESLSQYTVPFLRASIANVKIPAFAHERPHDDPRNLMQTLNALDVGRRQNSSCTQARPLLTKRR